MAVTALLGSVAGTGLAAALPSRVLTVVVLVALVAVGVYTWRRPELGVHHAPRFDRRHQLLVMSGGGWADRVLGRAGGTWYRLFPGVLVGWLRIPGCLGDRKVVNTAINLGALLVSASAPT